MREFMDKNDAEGNVKIPESDSLKSIVLCERFMSIKTREYVRHMLYLWPIKRMIPIDIFHLNINVLYELISNNASKYYDVLNISQFII